jgi:hypothetical protein
VARREQTTGALLVPGHQALRKVLATVVPRTRVASRWFLFVSDVDPVTFVFFFTKGATRGDRGAFVSLVRRRTVSGELQSSPGRIASFMVSKGGGKPQAEGATC